MDRRGDRVGAADAPDGAPDPFVTKSVAATPWGAAATHGALYISPELGKAGARAGTNLDTDRPSMPPMAEGAVPMEAWKTPEWSEINMSAEIGGYQPDEPPDNDPIVEEASPQDEDSRPTIA
jgi:hypothetical protein